jgi:hypothetical protein
VTLKLTAQQETNAELFVVVIIITIIIIAIVVIIMNFSLLSFSWEIFTYPGMYHQQD